MSEPVAGWHPDPWGVESGQHRWFDGTEWTGHVHDSSQPALPQGPAPNLPAPPQPTASLKDLPPPPAAPFPAYRWVAEPVRAEVWGTPEEFSQRISLHLAGAPKHSLTYGPGTIVVTRRYTPGWAIFLAIFLFPVGLIALVAKAEDTGTIGLTFAGGDRTTLAISGHFTKIAQRRINAAIRAGATPEAAPA
jgi:hypothetical protein